MTSKTVSQPPADVTIKVGVVILTTTVSSVVWWHICLWLWNWAARHGWWEPAADGVRVISAVVAVAVTWLIWGRVTYWMTMPDLDKAGADRPG